MAAAPWTYKTLCKNPQCGHDKDTHHEGKHNCLASRCDCQAYDDGKKRPSTIPPPPDTPRMFGATKPHADTSCTCRACLDWEREKIGSYSDDDAPITWPWP